MHVHSAIGQVARLRRSWDTRVWSSADPEQARQKEWCEVMLMLAMYAPCFRYRWGREQSPGHIHHAGGGPLMMRTAVPATCTELATMRERGGGVQQWVDYDHVVYLLHFSNTEASRCSLSRRKGKLLGYGRLVQTWSRQSFFFKTCQITARIFASDWHTPRYIERKPWFRRIM